MHGLTYRWSRKTICVLNKRTTAFVPLFLLIFFVTGAPLGHHNSCCKRNQSLLTTILEQVRANAATLAKNAETLAKNEARLRQLRQF